MTSSLINTVTSATYTIQANDFQYFYSATPNTVITLPPYGQQMDINPIYIINTGATATAVKDSAGVTLDTIQPGFMIRYVFSSVTNTWLTVQSSAVKPAVSNVGGPIVPILVDPAPVNNNQFFGTQATSNSGTSFNAFSTGGAQFWVPTGTGAEFLQVVSPTPVVVKAILLQLRAVSGLQYFNNVTLQASLDGNPPFVTLYTFPLAVMQSPNVSFSRFANETPYSVFRVAIGNTVGPVANIGIFNMQIYGYYNLSL